jgi:hypothetical protein
VHLETRRVVTLLVIVALALLVLANLQPPA